MQARKSEKINLIDLSTFEQIQQNDDKIYTGISREIRNSKYRKKHKNDENNLDLVAWITIKHRQKGQKHSHHKKGATLFKQTCNVRKPGKISENRRKKLTRLKKSIMRYRVLKHQNEKQLEDPKSTEQSIKSNLEKNNVSMEIVMPNQDLLVDQVNKIKLSDHINPNNDNNETDSHKNLAGIAEKLSNLTIHSRRFREYCDNCTTQELANLTRDLLHDLNHFQRRAYSKNPVKANAHRRFVIGFREVQNNLKIKHKIKLVLIAPDCEKCLNEGGIDEIIESIKSDCKSADIPYAFSLDRRQLAYALHKKGIVSIVGILDYDGVREKFSQFLSTLKCARQEYRAITNK